MLHKQAKNYLLIQKVQKYLHAKSDSLLDYDRGQCVDSSYLNYKKLFCLSEPTFSNHESKQGILAYVRVSRDVVYGHPRTT